MAHFGNTIVVCLFVCGHALAQDINLYNSQLEECRSGTKPFSCVLYAQVLEHQATAGGNSHLSAEGSCLRQRAHSLNQFHKSCSSDPSTSQECSDISQHLVTDQSVEECQKLSEGAGIEISVLTSSAPGCKGQMQVDAHNDSWQPALTLEAGQTGRFYLPVGNRGPQQWMVIDPANRGANDATGNGVRAGDGFAAPGLPEGALLVKGGDSKIKTFDKPVGSVDISVPGEVAFLANDTQGVNDHHLIHFGFHGNGFDDNSGSLTMNWVKFPCPIPHASETARPKPRAQGDVQIVADGSCNQTGNEMFLTNTTNHLITATIRRDIDGQSGNIVIPLASNQRFDLGCTVGAASSQWTWSLISVQ